MIVTEFVHPSIPDRRFDWAVYDDNHDETGPVGRGRTLAEALADYLTILEDEDWLSSD